MPDAKLPDVVWRPRAELDLKSIVIYIGYEQGQPQAAKRIHDSIVAAVERVRLFPEIGKRVDIEELRHGDYRYVIAGNYYVFYRYLDDPGEARIAVYRVLHQRQDIDTYGFVNLS